MADLTNVQLILLALVFVWSGFVRSGIGFGGAALALPLMLLILPDPVVLIPIIASHFIFFSVLTFVSNPGGIDWRYYGYSQIFLAVPAILGILGLINFSSDLLTIIVLLITFFYGAAYLLQLKISSGNKYSDGLLLILGGYVSGTAMTGAPLIAIVYSRNVAIEKVRNSLFVSFLTIVVAKMLAFKATGVDLQLRYALYFLPAAAVGHYIGRKLHQKIVSDDASALMRIIGGALIVVTLIGFYRYW